MIISQILLQKTTFHPKKFFHEKDSHSKRERKELINLHLKRFLAGDY